MGKEKTILKKIIGKGITIWLCQSKCMSTQVKLGLRILLSLVNKIYYMWLGLIEVVCFINEHGLDKFI